MCARYTLTKDGFTIQVATHLFSASGRYQFAKGALTIASSGLRPPSPHPMRRRNYFVGRFPRRRSLAHGHQRPTPG